jgi:serine/threonine protein kinase
MFHICNNLIDLSPVLEQMCLCLEGIRPLRFLREKSMLLFICLCICLFICLFLYLFTNLFVCLWFYIIHSFVYLLICLFVVLFFIIDFFFFCRPSFKSDIYAAGCTLYYMMAGLGDFYCVIYYYLLYL